MLKKRYAIVIAILLIFVGCDTKNINKDKITITKVLDEHIGGLTTDGDYIYYASYEMNAGESFPRSTSIKRQKKLGESTETIYEFDKPINISYMKAFDNKLIMVGDHLDTDSIYVLDGKSLTKVDDSCANVGEINPSYSGKLLTWVDIKNNTINMLDLETLKINKKVIDNLNMKPFERPYNFEGKTYVFQNESKSIEGSDTPINIISIDWENNKLEKLVSVGNYNKRQGKKYINVEVNDDYIKWEEKDRKGSKLYVYDNKQNHTKTYSDNFDGYIKHSALLNDKVYVFDESGQYGIEVLDIKNDKVNKLEDVYNNLKETSIFSPIYPYRYESGFVTEVNSFNRKSFLLLEAK